MNIAKNEEITDFINKFNVFEKQNVLKDTFTQGFCYFFSVILHERFKEGEIVYDVIKGHFIYKINNSFFDITGEINEPEKYYSFNNFPDDLQKKRIERDCILKKDNGV